MKRTVLTLSAGLLLVMCMTGCGGGASDIPEGYSEDDIKATTDTPEASPGSEIEGPTKDQGTRGDG